MSKENTEKNLKKLLRGERACIPGNFLRIPKQRNGGTVLNYGKGVPLSEGKFGVTYRGSINANGKRYVAYKEIKIDPRDTTPGAFEFEFKVAQKLKEFSVPDMFLFKKCPIQDKDSRKIRTNNGRVIQPEKRTEAKDIIYMELIDGESFHRWFRTNPSLDAVKTVITQVIDNLYRIRQKYPTFRHRDLHTGNVMVATTGKNSKYTWRVGDKEYEQENPGVTAYIIDFGLSYWSDRMPNPETAQGGYEHAGIYKNIPGSIYYDTHRFLYSIYRTVRQPVNAKERAIKNFIEELVPKEFLEFNGPYTSDGMLITKKLPQVIKFPTFKDILTHPFLTGEKKTLSKTLEMIPKAKTPPRVKTPKPKTKTPSPKLSTAERKRKMNSAIKRAAAVLAAKPRALKRPGIAGGRPPVPPPKPRTVTPSPKSKTKTPVYKFINIKGKERVFKSKAWYEKALAKNKDLNKFVNSLSNGERDILKKKICQS